jgi:hypothetical protein
MTNQKIKIANIHKISLSTKSEINKDLQKLCKTYYPSIPLNEVFNILEKKNLVALQEDNTKWSGILTGTNETIKLELAHESSKNNNEYIPLDNSMLILSWYKMPSGNYEINSYLS